MVVKDGTLHVNTYGIRYAIYVLYSIQISTIVYTTRDGEASSSRLAKRVEHNRRGICLALPAQYTSPPKHTAFYVVQAAADVGVLLAHCGQVAQRRRCRHHRRWLFRCHQRRRRSTSSSSASRRKRVRSGIALTPAACAKRAQTYE